MLSKERILWKMSKINVSILFVALTTILLSACGGSESTGSYGRYGDGNSVTLSWQAPTTNEDGTALSDLAGYRVYYGTSTSAMNENITVGAYTSCNIGNLFSGETYYFAVTAYDTSGNESSYSNVISKTFDEI